jgi:hypothetical protein
VAWEKMSEQTKKLNGEEIRLLCAADRVPGRVEELNVMRQLLIKLVNETKYFPAMNNRILLEVIDYGDDLPTDRDIETLPKRSGLTQSMQSQPTEKSSSTATGTLTYLYQ